MNMDKTHWHVHNGMGLIEDKAYTLADHLSCMNEHIRRMKVNLAAGPQGGSAVTLFDCDGFWLARWMRACGKAATDSVGKNRVGIVYRNMDLHPGPILVLSQKWFLPCIHQINDFEVTFHDDAKTVAEELDGYGMKPPTIFIMGAGVVES